MPGRKSASDISNPKFIFRMRMTTTNIAEEHSPPVIASMEMGSDEAREVVPEVEEVVSTPAKEKGKGNMSKWATFEPHTSLWNVTYPRQASKE